MTLQLVDGKPFIQDDERHSTYLAWWLNSIILDLVVLIMPNAPK
jgi:hypothetical protein